MHKHSHVCVYKLSASTNHPSQAHCRKWFMILWLLTLLPELCGLWIGHKDLSWQCKCLMCFQQDFNPKSTLENKNAPFVQTLKGKHGVHFKALKGWVKHSQWYYSQAEICFSNGTVRVNLEDYKWQTNSLTLEMKIPTSSQNFAPFLNPTFSMPVCLYKVVSEKQWHALVHTFLS